MLCNENYMLSTYVPLIYMQQLHKTCPKTKVTQLTEKLK
jgi:hypothetical protein